MPNPKIDFTPATPRVDQHPALNCTDLRKSFGTHTVFSGITFSLNPGSSTWLSGPNGAGKTTLLASISGGCELDSGEVAIGGYCLATQAVSAKTRLGYAADEPYLYPFLSALEHIQLWAGLRRCGSLEVNRAHELMASLSLASVKTDQVRTYSRGLRQQLGFVGAIFHSPQLLLLDEPGTALDPANAQVCWDYLRQYRSSGGALLFTSHSAEVVLALSGEQLQIFQPTASVELTGASA